VSERGTPTLDNLNYLSEGLELEHFPYKHRLWIILIPLFMTLSAMTAEKVTFTCVRSQSEQGMCRITRIALLQPSLVTTRKFPLALLQRAKEEGAKDCRRIYLQLEDSEDFPAASSCRARSNPDHWKNVPAFKYNVSQINNFLAVKTERSLKVESESYTWVAFWIFLLPSISFFVWMIANSQSKVTLIDTKARQLTLTSHRLLGRSTETYDLDQVAWVEVEEDRFGNYWLELVLRSRKRVRLTNVYLFIESNHLRRSRSLNGDNRPNLQALCDRINQFLHAQSNNLHK
jgi:hypothetical protein